MFSGGNKSFPQGGGFFFRVGFSSIRGFFFNPSQFEILDIRVMGP